MENHTFDSMLGYWCDDHPSRCPDGGMPSAVTLSNGAVVVPGVMPDIVPQVLHTVQSQQAAIDGGKMDGWQKIPGCGPKGGYACISGYQPSQIPNTIRLARSFAISDHTFSMAASPSWGGHLYAATGSLDGFLGANPKPAKGEPRGPGWGCNSYRITPWRAKPTSQLKWVPSCVPDPSLGLPNGGAFRSTPVSYLPTILDRLNAAGKSWRIYGDTTPKGYTDTGYAWDICPTLAECFYTAQHKNNVAAKTFIPDAQAGALPDFSTVTPGGQDAIYSEHNGLSITAGDNWIGRVTSAVMNSPDWSSTVLFITWDDCGCFYDQVPPGTNPDGTSQGPRVPLIVVSPYAKPGYTDTTATTFAGVLAYTEHNFGLAPLGVNDALAYPFTTP
jgi:phospholipase C